jgi:hypothetical protein
MTDRNTANQADAATVVATSVVRWSSQQKYVAVGRGFVTVNNYG